MTQIWYGMDFRQHRPTPVEEARWGFAVVEDSLWRAVPEFLRRLDTTLRERGLAGLPLEPTKPLSPMCQFLMCLKDPLWARERNQSRLK